MKKISLKTELEDVWLVICILSKYKHFNLIVSELELYYFEIISYFQNEKDLEVERGLLEKAKRLGE